MTGMLWAFCARCDYWSWIDSLSLVCTRCQGKKTKRVGIAKIKVFPSLGIITGPLWGHLPSGARIVVARWMFEISSVSEPKKKGKINGRTRVYRSHHRSSVRK